jgi:hypothetical protein
MSPRGSGPHGHKSPVFAAFASDAVDMKLGRDLL